MNVWEATDGRCKVFNQNEVDEGPVYKDVAIIKGIRKACWASKGLATLEAVTARWSEGARNGKVRGAAWEAPWPQNIEVFQTPQQGKGIKPFLPSILQSPVNSSRWPQTTWSQRAVSWVMKISEMNLQDREWRVKDRLTGRIENNQHPGYTSSFFKTQITLSWTSWKKTTFSSCVWIFIIELVWKIFCKIKSVLECLISLVHIRRVERWSQIMYMEHRQEFCPKVVLCVIWVLTTLKAIIFNISR